MGVSEILYHRNVYDDHNHDNDNDHVYMKNQVCVMNIH